MEALIVIDMVNAYKKDATKEIINNQIKIIQSFKKSKLPVIYTVPKGKEENPVMLKLWGKELVGDEKKPKGKKKRDLIPQIINIKPNKIIKKEEYSAFFKTDLEEYCKQKKITELYLAGLYSGVCVHYTGIDAAMRKIMPILITDATSTSRKNWHKENCKRFKQVAGPTKTTKEVLEEIQPVIIRKFREEDANSISHIMKKCNEYTKEHAPATTKALSQDSTPKRIIEKSKTRQFYVAIIDEKVVGVCGYKENEIKTFFVNPQHHGKGIGRKLIEKCFLQMKDYSEIVVKSSLFAVPIYEKFGFKKIKKKTVSFSNTTLTFVEMKKKL